MAENAAREDQHEPERHEPEHHEPGARHGTPPQKGGKVKRFLDDHKLAVISVALGVLGILIVLWLRNRSSSSSASTTTPSGATLGQGNAPGSSGGGGGTWWPGTGTGAGTNPGSTTTPNVTVNVPSQPAPVVNVTLAGSSGAKNVKKAPKTPTTPASLVAAAPPPTSLPTTGIVPNMTTQTPSNISGLIQTPTNQLAQVASIGGYNAGAPGAQIGKMSTAPVQLPQTSTPLSTVTARTASESLGTGPGRSVVTQSKSPAKAVSSRAHALSGGQTSLTQAQALQI